MVTEWIQFSLLMLALIGIALRNEHRMTQLEGCLKLQEALRKELTKRVEKLEEKNA
jgi:hypothetical protein